MKKIIYALDLQLFAYDPQAQPVNYTGSATLAAEDKEYYDKTLIRYAEPKLVHDQFGQKRNIPTKNGKKVTFRSFASLGKQTTPLVEGITPDGQTLSVTEIESTVNQYGGFVALTDMLELAAIDPVITETVRLIGDQAGLTMDTVVRDVLNTGTNVAYTASVIGNAETEIFYRHELDSTCKLTVKEIEKNVTELRSQNAPTFDGYYVAIVHPKAIYDLMRDPDWRKAQQYTDQVTKIYKGEVGEIGGCRFVTSTEAKIIKGADLASDSRTLTVNGAATGNGANVTFDGGTVEANALKGRYVIIDGERYIVMSNTSSVLTLNKSVTCADNTVIYPGEGGKDGCAVFCTLMLGQDAYGTTEIEGGGLETIIKQRGSAGTSDPLDQRSTVGWKGVKTAEILIEQYIRRIESAGTYASTTAAN